MKPIHHFATVFWLLLLSSAHAADKLQVYTVNYPLQYFAERIGGDAVDVQLPAPDDVDPAFWMPDANTINDYQQADLILLNGAGYAKWVAKVSLPRRKLVNTSSAFVDDYLRIEDNVTHQHGPAGDHSHAGTAFTTWLDFTQAAMQAEQIALAMKKARPEHARGFDENARQLQHDLQQLDKALQGITAGNPGVAVLASHPVYQYLARRYGLNLRSLMWEPDTLPEPGEWQALEALLAEHPATVMLWEDEPLKQIRENLSAMGISIVVFRPGMNRPLAGDFMSVMRANIGALGLALEAEM